MKWLLLIIPLLILSACAPTRYIPVESVHTEIEYRDRLQTRTDSIHITDSIYIREKGDTVFMERWRTLYRDRLQTDTAYQYICVTDTVQKPYPVPTPLTSWQRFKQDVGGIAIGVLGAALILGLIWLLRHIKST